MARRPVAAALSDDQVNDDRAQAYVELQDQHDDQDDDAGEQDEPEVRRAAEPEPQDDEQDDQGDEGEQPAPRGRARERDDDPRISDLESRLAEANRLAQETQQRLNALAQERQPRETPEQEAARLALMTPAELVAYNRQQVNEALSVHDKRIQMATLAANNTADKAAFEAKITNNPQWRKLAPEVERRAAEMHSKGAYPTRETILTYMLGEQAMKLAANSGKQRDARRERVERQTTRPQNSRSDVQPQRRGGSQSLEERLADVPL